MGTEFSSGVKFRVGDRIKGYEIVQVFDPGAFAFAGQARTASGRPVFFKKYKRPGGSSPWLNAFVAYQSELKSKIESFPPAKGLCYEFVEFFELSKSGTQVPLKVFYQVFEWIEGGSDLRKVIESSTEHHGKYDWSQKVMFAKMMMAGVNAIHKAGIIHTDLKPENLYLVPDAALQAKYKLRVIDMDFSLLDGRKAPWEGYEASIGTPGYMSPEHLRGQTPLKASDVFTCGLMLGELLGGTHPAAPNLDGYDALVKNGGLKSIHVPTPIDGVPDQEFLNAVLDGCLRLEADRRPTAEQLLLALNGRLDRWDGRTPGARPAPPPPPPPAGASVKAAEPAAPTAEKPQTAADVVELVGPQGQRIAVRITTTLGRAHFRGWGDDYNAFFSAEQFRLTKASAGRWLIEDCLGATNTTNVDGVPLADVKALRSGMMLTLGKSGKCPISIQLR